jgi:UDP-glucose 4-epimerase
MTIPRYHLDDFAGRRVLITGGAGMIGSTIAHALVKRGAEVTIFDAMLPQYGGRNFNLTGIEDRVRMVRGDVRERARLAPLVVDVDTIFNLAAQVSYIRSNEDPWFDLDINCRGQLNLLDACREAGGGQRIIFASSRFVYGEIDYNPVDERHPFNCQSIYGIHKLAAEKYHRYYHLTHGLRTVSLRFANPYGPRQQMQHSLYGIVNWFVRLALEGRELTVYGDGNQKRDYIFVEDIAEASLAVALLAPFEGEVYNVGCGTGTPFREMAACVAAAVPGTRVVSAPWPAKRVLYETGDYISDITRLRKLTGWQPTHSLTDGVARTVAYYRQHRAQYW